MRVRFPIVEEVAGVTLQKMTLQKVTLQRVVVNSEGHVRTHQRASH
jgi:hypothetical protein